MLGARCHPSGVHGCTWLHMKHKFPGDLDEFGWSSLGFLPHGVLQILQSEFGAVDVFYNSFDDESGAKEILSQLMTDVAFQATGPRMVHELLEWKDMMGPKVTLMLRSKCLRMGERMSSARPDTDATRAAREFEDIVRNDPFHALEVAKRKCKSLNKSGGMNTRAEKEAAALAKYTYELGLVVSEADRKSVV